MHLPVMAFVSHVLIEPIALASQSLTVMISLIPYIRETFRRHLNSKQAVMLVEFDKLKRDYQEHQNEIHAKLIAIMGERLTAHCKSLQEVRWDIPPPQQGPNAYVEQLVKETVTLHKVLSKYLGGGSAEVRLPRRGLPPSNKFGPGSDINFFMLVLGSNL